MRARVGLQWLATYQRISVGHITHHTQLPFLYQTRTISNDIGPGIKTTKPDQKPYKAAGRAHVGKPSKRANEDRTSSTRDPDSPPLRRPGQGIAQKRLELKPDTGLGKLREASRESRKKSRVIVKNPPENPGPTTRTRPKATLQRNNQIDPGAGRPRRASGLIAKGERDDKELGRAAPVREDFIPFDDSSERLLDRESTVTESERHIFERLRSVGRAKTPPPTRLQSPLAIYPDRQSARLRATSELDAILDEAVSEMLGETIKRSSPLSPSPPLPPSESPAPTASSKPATQGKNKKGSKTSQAAAAKNVATVSDVQQTELSRIMYQINKAGTDTALWEVVETEIMDPIKALDLDRSKTSETVASVGVSKGRPPKTKAEVKKDRDLEKAKQKKKQEEPAKEEPPDPRSRDVVAPNFPQLLFHAAKVLRETYPSSLYNLSILEQLRLIGPSAFALGATTGLYNEAIAYTFETRSDIPAITDLLEDMEKNFVEPNARTRDILAKVNERTLRIRQGFYGDANRAVAAMDRMKKSMNGIDAVFNRIKKELPA